MPQAVTHFLVPVILLELFRQFFIKDKKTFSIHYIFIAGLAGLLPDFDMAVYYILGFFGYSVSTIHRTFSHTLFVPVIFIASSIFFKDLKIKKLGKHHLQLKKILLAIAFGTAIHLLLDATISGAIMPLYPFFTFKFGFNLIHFIPEQLRDTIIPTIDAVILISWMVSLEIRKKISNFI